MGTVLVYSAVPHMEFGACTTAALPGFLPVSAQGSGATLKGPCRGLVRLQVVAFTRDKQRNYYLFRKLCVELVISNVLWVFS